jgi:hypothetical protein
LFREVSVLLLLALFLHLIVGIPIADVVPHVGETDPLSLVRPKPVVVATGPEGDADIRRSSCDRHRAERGETKRRRKIAARRLPSDRNEDIGSGVRTPRNLFECPERTSVAQLLDDVDHFRLVAKIRKQQQHGVTVCRCVLEEEIDFAREIGISRRTGHYRKDEASALGLRREASGE